ncbi:unnamed protein product [Tuber aestivum]|uniref:F-box domain-containing protein n=1 Tax=Tuber aestivum TaxID=59557 RepID=A0A292PZI5_9PEZI|nr:unnamed protein product [Tuber aestivum]
MASVTESRRGMRDFISDLPPELSRLILSRLEIRDVFMCAAVCRAWRSHTRINDSLYIPHLLQKYSNITHGRDPIPPRANIGQELLQRFPHLSASSYFCNPKSLRDLALRDMHLRNKWKSGIPRRRANLNACMKHNDVIFSVVIDQVYGLIVSGDRSGGVVFWSTRTQEMIKELSLAQGPNEDVPAISPAISAMAVKGDHLVIGTWHLTVHIARRDSEDSPIENRAFSLVSSFQVPSPVISIILEGETCIVGCHRGEVVFYSIGIPEENPNTTNGEDSITGYNPTHLLTIQIPRRAGIRQPKFNLSMHYRKPFLFTSSDLVSQLTPKRMDQDNGRDLWQYEAQDITIKTSSGNMSGLDPDYLCMLRPLCDEGDLLVAWPDLSVYSLGNFNSRLVWTPKSKVLVDRAHSQPVRCMGTIDGFFLTGSFDNSVRLFGENGTPVHEPFIHQGAVNSLATDPCFFVSVSDDKTVMLWDFTPPSYETGESTFSSPGATSTLSSSESSSSPATSPPSTPGL